MREQVIYADAREHGYKNGKSERKGKEIRLSIYYLAGNIYGQLELTVAKELSRQYTMNPVFILNERQGCRVLLLKVWLKG